MAVTLTPRVGLTLASADTDPFPTRTTRNADMNAIEAAMAIYGQGNLSARPAAGKVGRFYWASDQPVGQKVYYDNGTAWELILPSAGGAASAQAPGDVAAAGTSTAFARSDHKHGLPAWAGSAVDLDYLGGAAGSASTFSRGDHKHALPSGIARTDTTATQNFQGDIQVQGQSVARGLVAIDRSTQATGYTSTTELMFSTLTSTFTAIAGHAYLIVFTYTHNMNSGGGEYQWVQLHDGTSTGSPVIDTWSEASAAILGVSNSRSITWQPSAGSHTVSPGIFRASGSNSVRWFSGQLAVFDMGT
jgi:hypothetical protein